MMASSSFRGSFVPHRRQAFVASTAFSALLDTRYLGKTLFAAVPKIDGLIDMQSVIFTPQLEWSDWYQHSIQYIYWRSVCYECYRLEFYCRPSTCSAWIVPFEFALAAQSELSSLKHVQPRRPTLRLGTGNVMPISALHKYNRMSRAGRPAMNNEFAQTQFHAFYRMPVNSVQSFLFGDFCSGIWGPPPVAATRCVRK